MGIWIRCDNSNIEFCSSYSYWSEIRMSIVQSFISFLRDWISNNSFDNCEGFEKYFYDMLKNLLEEFSLTNKSIGDYNIVFENYVNALACFELLGIYSLINKQDCEAYYSCGNALDMYMLINKIKNYINKEHKQSIMLFKKVLKYSIDHKQPIIIS